MVTTEKRAEALSKLTFFTKAELDAYINNPANYKKTKKKVTSIWCCVPPEGTQISNALPTSLKMTTEQMPVVLMGTRKEQWIIDIATLSMLYTFTDGRAITALDLNRKMHNGRVTWFGVKSKPVNTTYWACFVPRICPFVLNTSAGVQQGNTTDKQHGFGDFIICRDDNGKPDLSARRIVNGLIFADTYARRGLECYMIAAEYTVNAAVKPDFEYGAHVSVKSDKDEKPKNPDVLFYPAVKKALKSCHFKSIDFGSANQDTNTPSLAYEFMYKGLNYDDLGIDPNTLVYSMLSFREACIVDSAVELQKKGQSGFACSVKNWTVSLNEAADKPVHGVWRILYQLMYNDEPICFIEDMYIRGDYDDVTSAVFLRQLDKDGKRIALPLHTLDDMLEYLREKKQGHKVLEKQSLMIKEDASAIVKVLLWLLKEFPNTST